MRRRVILRFLILLVLAVITISVSAQTVPLGINYQAVTRDNSGKELVNQIIQVKFSILSGSAVGEIAYEELHSNVRTTSYGVFSLIIGEGTRLSGTAEGLSGIAWDEANQYLKVEVDFGQGFISMGTMQFFAVPYALYAKRSLEPGPQGPVGPQGAQGPKGEQGLKGDQGDPATDNQKLSFDGTNLSIAPNGNTVNLSTLNVPHNLTILGDTLSIFGGNKIGLPNQIQDLTLDGSNILKITKNATASSIDLSKYLDNKDQQTLSFNQLNNNLTISGGNSADLTPMKQDLLLTGNNLTITNKLSPAVIDLSKYLQSLSFNSTTNKLSISNVAGEIDLTGLKNDADSDPLNEIQDLSLSGNELTITNKTSPAKINLAAYLDNTDNQTLSYNLSNYTLSLTNGGSAVIGSLICFRAKKTISETGLSFMTDFDFISGNVDYNDGLGYDGTAGVFTAPTPGIYTFNISYTATGSGDARTLKLYLNGGLYEILNSGITATTSLTRSSTMKLITGDKVKVIINTGTSTETGTGSFSGFRIY